jgi:hypothetical protein
VRAALDRAWAAGERAAGTLRDSDDGGALPGLPVGETAGQSGACHAAGPTAYQGVSAGAVPGRCVGREK